MRYRRIPTALPSGDRWPIHDGGVATALASLTSPQCQVDSPLIRLLDYVFSSTVTYTTFGYGDITPKPFACTTAARH
ncbi:ion channel [Litchfieldella rifensis]|uniref:Ion channel n=1 Tax=Litchfieldella rifensis TaxID=762643 RepID=A0ABV7LN44_9GAMM